MKNIKEINTVIVRDKNGVIFVRFYGVKEYYTNGIMLYITDEKNRRSEYNVKGMKIEGEAR